MGRAAGGAGAPGGLGSLLGQTGVYSFCARSWRRARVAVATLSTSMTMQNLTTTTRTADARGMLQADAHSSLAREFLRFARSKVGPFAVGVLVVYVSLLTLLMTSRWAQNMMVYLHWIQPPRWFAPLQDLGRYRMDATTRNIEHGNLRGWHLLPPGPPHAPPRAAFRNRQPSSTTTAKSINLTTSTDTTALQESTPLLVERSGLGRAVSSTGKVTAMEYSDAEKRAQHLESREEFFDQMLATPASRIVIWYHGNAGHRAWPAKRIDMLRLLSAELQAHVVTFDYTGFGDSAGTPTDAQFYEDALRMLDWVRKRAAPDAEILLYGQSLGTFAAARVAAEVSARDDITNVKGVVLDAAPANLLDAAMTHPSMRVFRILPGFRSLCKAVLHDKHDSIEHAKGIKIPLLCLHGDRDTFIDIDQGKKVFDAAIANGNENAFFVAFEGAGHTDVNCADDFVLVLAEFVGLFMSPVVPVPALETSQ